MIVNKTAKLIDSYVEFSYETPLRGLVSITNLTEVITGTTGTRFFEKQFAYTLDGVKYSKWETLTLGALQAISGGVIPIESDFIVKFRYIRRGTDASGDLTIDSLVINGTYSLAYLQILDLSNTVFEDIGFTDEYWNKVWINLLKKLYGRGIVPEYIQRQDNDQDDADYIVQFKSVAYFFALTVALVDDKISKIKEKVDDLSEFLIQRGVFAYSDNSISALNLIANYIYDEIRRRATIDISRIDGSYLAPLANPKHGELLRLINFQMNDEFLFEYLKRENGWYVDCNFAESHGLQRNKQLNKWFDSGESVDLSNFTITGTVDNLDFDSRDNMMRMQPSSTATSKSIKVDSHLSYELTFWLKTSLDGVNLNTLTLQVLAATANGTSLSILDSSNGLAFDEFLTSHANANTSSGVYYFVRCKIYKDSEPNLTFPYYQTNLNTGKNLRFVPNTERIQLKFTAGAVAGGQIAISDIKLKPLMQTKNNCFLDSGDMTRIWTRNRNFDLSSKVNPTSGLTIEQLLNMKIRDSLIPFSSTLILENFR